VWIASDRTPEQIANACQRLRALAAPLASKIPFFRDLFRLVVIWKEYHDRRSLFLTQVT
jgi:hypothetical protein